MTAARVKISVSLPKDLVATVDREARASPAETRSSVIEQWLRQGASRQAEAQLRDEVIAYYRGLDAEARAEDSAIGRGASRAARRLVIDRPTRRR